MLCSADVTNQTLDPAWRESCDPTSCDLIEAKHASGQRRIKASNTPQLPPRCGEGSDGWRSAVLHHVGARIAARLVVWMQRDVS
jgi:hypothetical protein